MPGQGNAAAAAADDDDDDVPAGYEVKGLKGQTEGGDRKALMLWGDVADGPPDLRGFKRKFDALKQKSSKGSAARKEAAATSSEKEIADEGLVALKIHRRPAAQAAAAPAAAESESYQEEVLKAYRQLKERRRRATEVQQQQKQQRTETPHKGRKERRKDTPGVSLSSKAWSYDKSLLYRNDWVFQSDSNNRH